MRNILQIFARALAAMAAVITVPVIEGGKLVWRTIRQALAPEQPIEDAEAELREALAEPVADVQLPTPAEEWGRAAGEYLVPTGVGNPEAVLDRAALAYLDALDVMERATLLAHQPVHIGEHLLGERALKALPRVLTPAEFAGAEGQTMAAKAEAVRKGLAVLDEKRAWVQAVLDELCEDEPARLRAA